MPLRNSPPKSAGDQRAGDDAILDAARRLVLTHGLARVTMTDVAREARLSRMTVYRRWERLSQLLGAMMMREWNALLDLDGLEARFLAAQGERSARHTLVATLSDVVSTLRTSELLSTIVQREPQLLTPYLLHRQGTMHRRATELITAAIAAGQADGSVRSGDPALLATSVVLAAQSWVLSTEAAGCHQPIDVLDRELSLLIDSYLAPPEAP